MSLAYAQELRVVISEVMWAGTDLSTADEWIELTGVYGGTGSVSPLSLSGWTITRLNDGAEETMITFGESVTIGSGMRLVVSNYAEEESRLSMVPNIVSSTVSLSNTKLLLRLRTASGTLIDSVDDGVGAPFAGSSTAPHASMERIELSGSGGIKTLWQTATTFLGFDDGASLFGTPGFPNGTGPSSDTFAPREATDLSAYIDSGALSMRWNPSVALDLDHQIMTIVPVLTDGSGSITFAKTASGFFTTDIVPSSGYTLTLTSVDVLGNASTGVSIASQPFPKVRITEVLSNPKGSDDDEWIEVGNLGSFAIDIAGWILDEGNSPGSFAIPYRSATGFTIDAGEHVVFRKPQTGLPLGNDGEELTLKKGPLIIDRWTYPETSEEVSYGRDPDDPTIFRPFCIPSPGRANTVTPLDPHIVIQSGETSSEEKVTVNLQAEVTQGSLDSAVCRWNYGDGFESSSCNPPSHTISAVGGYDIRLTVDTFCGDRIIRTLHVNVLEPQEKGLGVGVGGSSGGSGGSRGSNRSITESCVPETSTGVVVNEILPDPLGKDTEGEWIELKNLTSQDFSLCGWWLDAFSLGAYEIPAHGFLVLPYAVTKLGLRNSGESVRLLRGEELVHDVVYGEAPEGQSFARGESGSFLWTSILTPGSENQHTQSGHSLSVAEHEPYILEVVLNEIFPSPLHVMVSSVEPRHAKDLASSSSFSNTEWLELFNPTDHMVDLSGWILDDSREKGSKPWVIPDGTEIRPKRFLMFTKEQTGLQLNNDGDDVWLLAPDESVSDGVTVPRVPHDHSWSRVPLRDRWCLSSQATPGQKNHCDRIVPEVSIETSEKKIKHVMVSRCHGELCRTTNHDMRRVVKRTTSIKTVYRNVPPEDRIPDSLDIPLRLAPLRAQILPFDGGDSREHTSFARSRSIALYKSFGMAFFLILSGGMLVFAVTVLSEKSIPLPVYPSKPWRSGAGEG